MNRHHDDHAFWRQTLDLFKASLDHHRRVLDGADEPAPSPWPPRELPRVAIPNELRQEAGQLVVRADKLSVEMTDRLSGRRTQLRRPRQQGAQEHPRWSTKM